MLNYLCINHSPTKALRNLLAIQVIMFALMREYIYTCFYTVYGEMATNINVVLVIPGMTNYVKLKF